jgi:hypothetical protein
MRTGNIFLLVCCLLLAGFSSTAQRTFTEGEVIYRVQLTSPDNTTVSGLYIFTIKDAEIKKELRLDNGYVDITLLNCANNTVYSLQNRNGTKYAIELSMAELLQKQQRYKGFRLAGETVANQKMAGYAAYRAQVIYADRSATEIQYTKEWRPAQAVTFNRFPDAPFFPLSFYYNEPSGNMKFNAQKMEACPVDAAVFRIPKDYKMISYEEYKQLIQE